MIANVNSIVSDEVAARVNECIEVGLAIAECWEWSGCRFSTGYGCVTVEGKNAGAHRVVWSMHNGMDVPDGLLVRHSCDNRACCNPYHLSVGTVQDNSDDMVSRSRQAQGEYHGMAKLSLEEAQAIVDSPDSYSRLAKRYGVTKTTIGSIKTGGSWGGFALQGVAPRKPRAKLNDESARAVFLAAGFQQEIAERFGITQKQVSYIKSGRAWGNATADLRGKR